MQQYKDKISFREMAQNVEITSFYKETSDVEKTTKIIK
jgi:hypothetical protein